MMVKHLEITTKIGCSNMCSYCPQELLIREYTKRSNEIYMSLETFSECLSKVDRNVDIGFTGMCEPFLNERCMDMIEIAAKGNPLCISTTLVGLKSQDIKRLERINFNLFAVHLPNNSGDNILVDKKYIELLKQIVNSSIPNKLYHYHGDTLHSSLNFVSNLTRKVGVHSRAGSLSSIKTVSKTGPVICKRKFAYPVLLPNGDLTLCCMDYGLTAVIGNLLTQSIEEIYSGSRFANLIEATKKDSGSICHICFYGNVY